MRVRAILKLVYTTDEGTTCRRMRQITCDMHCVLPLAQNHPSGHSSEDLREHLT